MANFQTHFNAGVIASSIAASGILSLQVVNHNDAIALWLLGVLGSILPDIDSDNSNALRIVFTLLGVTASLFGALFCYRALSLTGLWLLCASIFLMIRFVATPIFERFTIHRGTLHSLLACLLFGLVFVQASLSLNKSIVFSLSAGCFVSLGMLVHLVLDECYSVDLSNSRIKRSFGSALKPFSIKYPLTTTAHVFICLYLWFALPSFFPLADAMSKGSVDIYSSKDWLILSGFINQ